MPTNNNVIETEEDINEAEKLFEEITKDLGRLKASPPKDHSAVAKLIVFSLMPYLRDLAWIVKSHEEGLQEVFANIEPEEQSTQFLPEHADKFKLIVTYAREMLKLSIEKGDASEPGQQDAVSMLATAEELLALIDESTLEPEGDEEGEGEEVEPQPAN